MVDADGLLTVKAMEKTTNTQAEITVKPSYGLDEHEMHRILSENAQHGEKDIRNRLLIEAKVKAQQLLHHLENALKVDGDLLTTLERDNLVAAMGNLEKHLTSADQDAIVEQQKMLESISVPFAERRVQRLMDNNGAFVKCRE
jgi:molecular chaperone HscA